MCLTKVGPYFTRLCVALKYHYNCTSPTSKNINNLDSLNLRETAATFCKKNNGEAGERAVVVHRSSSRTR